MEPTPGATSKLWASARRFAPAVAVPFAAYVFVLAFPRLARVEGPVETSWALELNRLVSGPHAFGRDVVFTHGPLGFLLYPLDVGSNLVWAWAVRLVVHAVLAASLAWWAVHLRTWVGGVVLAVALAVAIPGGLDFEHEWVLVVAILATAALETGSRTVLAVAAAAAAAGLFAKTSVGVGALAALLVVAMLWMRWRAGHRWEAAYAGLGAAAAILACSLLLSSVSDLPGWFGRALALALAEGEATAGSTSPAIRLATWRAVLPTAAFLLLAVSLLVTVVLRRRWTPAAALAAALAPGAFIALKHSLFRLDALHAPTSFAFAAAAAGAVALVALGWQERVAAAAVLAIAFAAPLGIVPPIGASPRSVLDAALLDPGLGRLRRWTGPGALRGDLAPAAVLGRLGDWYSGPPAGRNAAAIGPGRLSFPALARAARGRTVGVIPSGQWLCAANGLDCVPAPTIWTYAACTADLDRWSAARYAAPGGPDLLLVGLEGIGGRNLALQAPETMRAVLQWYEPARAQPVPGWLLLARRAGARSLAIEPLEGKDVAAGDWVALPRSRGPVVLTPDLRLGWQGALAGAALRAGPVMLEVRRASGAQESFPIVADTSRSGIVASDVPRDLADLARSFAGGRVRDPVVAVRFAGEGIRSYRSPFRVALAALPAAGDEAPSRATASVGPPAKATPPPPGKKRGKGTRRHR